MTHALTLTLTFDINIGIDVDTDRKVVCTIVRQIASLKTTSFDGAFEEEGAWDALLLTDSGTNVLSKFYPTWPTSRSLYVYGVVVLLLLVQISLVLQTGHGSLFLATGL